MTNALLMNMTERDCGYKSLPTSIDQRDCSHKINGLNY